MPTPPTLSENPADALLATAPALSAAAARFDGAPLVAVDTEFVREETYYPRLCLIQIATPETAAGIDCLADADIETLLAALFRAGTTWVLHSARQDLEVIWQRTQRMPPALIDTQIAAALCGFAPQSGLETLLAKTLGVELGESFARFDWSRRPLPEDALRYALDDVRHLLPAWTQLENRLNELGRREWLTEDCARLLAERPVADPAAVFARLPGALALPRDAQLAALSLVRWREQHAQRVDRPRRWILADDALVAIAKTLPAVPGELEPLVPPRLAAKHGAAILAAVAARASDDNVAVIAAGEGRAVPDRKRLKELQEHVRARAATLGIEPEILATRRDLAALLAGAPPRHFVAGWRAAALGL